jgi:ABC-type siderophore export system fused ATPase/permease subunit
MRYKAGPYISFLPLLILTKTELLDSYATGSQVDVFDNVRYGQHDEDSAIGMRDASFSWSNNGGASTSSPRNFLLRVEGELLFAMNKINVILGPTGSGKTSLLMALLGQFTLFTRVMNNQRCQAKCISCPVGLIPGLTFLA